jgi:hypothetical protein
MPIFLTMFLSWITCNLFGVVWLNLMHGQLPRKRWSDPSALVAIGLALVPIINFPWMFFTYMRLMDRIDEERTARGLDAAAPWQLVIWTCLLAPFGWFLIILILFVPRGPGHTSTLIFLRAAALLVSAVNAYVLTPLLVGATQAAVNGLVQIGRQPSASRGDKDCLDLSNRRRLCSAMGWLFLLNGLYFAALWLFFHFLLPLHRPSDDRTFLMYALLAGVVFCGLGVLASVCRAYGLQLGVAEIERAALGSPLEATEQKLRELGLASGAGLLLLAAVAVLGVRWWRSTAGESPSSTSRITASASPPQQTPPPDNDATSADSRRRQLLNRFRRTTSPDEPSSGGRGAASNPVQKTGPTEPPPTPAPPTDGERYLRELAPTDVDTIDDKTNHAIDRAFTVGKVQFEHGVYLHPPARNSSAEASYPLEEGYQRLRGAVGIRDDVFFPRAKSPLTFRLLGDGNELWRSRAPLQAAGEWEPFDVDLTGVRRLTLQVDCPGDHTGAHAAWLDPILVCSASGAPRVTAASAEPAEDHGPSPAPGGPSGRDVPGEAANPDPPPGIQRPSDGVAALPREDYPAPPQAKTPREGERYLRDLKPAKVETHIVLRLDRTFTLARVEYQHGVTLCLRLPGRPSHVTYELDQSYSRFRGAAGVPDNGISGCKSPMTLRILADGAEVWKSKRIQHSGDWGTFDVDLTGVRELQLSVQAEGNVDGGHAVWLDPLLVE